jgi:rhodanese-related sulfurtransferase
MKEITVDELRALGDGGATILNVGSHQGRREIRGAVRYRPHDLLTPEHLALPLPHDRPVVLYDEKGNEDHTGQIAGKLEAEGYDARGLQGGFAAWEHSDGPTQEPTMEQVVPPMRADEVQKLDRRA